MLNELKEELRKLEAQEDRLGSQAYKRMEALRAAVEEAEAAASQPSFLLKPREECDLTWASLCIVDEISMVGKAVAEDLLSFGCKLLVLGDPAQLPPVKDTGYFTDRQPDYLLTEVHRQAAGSPILRLATLAREGKSLPYGEWETEAGAARVVRSVGAATAQAAEQLLCGLNVKRQAINARTRQLQGQSSPMPQAGEKLVCLRNDREQGLMNGTQWLATEDSAWEPGDADVGLTVIPIEGGVDMTLRADAGIFLDESKRPAWGTAQQFTWGYCMTTHKAQGSQWDSVVAWDDWPRRDSHREWLYTTVTRAAQDLTVVV